MKISHLKQLIQAYDKRKGLRRRFFGDALQIVVLKELISDKEASLEANSDPEISLQAYQTFANKKGYAVDLSDRYLASNSASSSIFVQWKREFIKDEAISQAISSTIPSRQIDLSSFISLSSINLEISRIALPLLQIDTTSILSRVNDLNAITLERLSLHTRPSEQWPYTQLNPFTLFRYPTNRASTAPQYSARNNEEDNNDDSYDHSPRCAPAA